LADAKEKPTATIRWDDSGIRGIYANVCNVLSTREEVSMLFGMNQKWDAENNQLVIELTERIVMNPYAAKRVALLLNNVIEQYEAKFGVLQLENDRPVPPVAKETLQ